MKKVVLFFALITASAVSVLAQDGEPSNVLSLVASVVGGIIVLSGFAAWLIKSGFGVIAGKIENGLEKTADILQGGASIARGAGFEKVATWTEEFADIPDQAGDVFGKLEEMTKNKDFTAPRIKELFDEGREVVVEAKDFILVIKKKK